MTDTVIPVLLPVVSVVVGGGGSFNGDDGEHAHDLVTGIGKPVRTLKPFERATLSYDSPFVAVTPERLNPRY